MSRERDALGVYPARSTAHNTVILSHIKQQA